MRGQSIVNNSIFGKISSDAVTMDGRNVGQMQAELAEYINTMLDKLVENKDKMKELDAIVTVDSVIRQGLRRKIWGSNTIDVLVMRDGRKAVQAVNANDIVSLTQDTVKAIYGK